MKNAIALVASAVCVVALAGCGTETTQTDEAAGVTGEGTASGGDLVADESSRQASNEDPATVVYTETIVTTLPDGTESVVTRPVTLAQQLAEQAAKAAATGTQQPLAYDPGAASSSEWLYDQTNATGNRIAFSHPALDCVDHDLNAYARDPSGTSADLVCNGITHKKRWAGGVLVCLGPGPSFRSLDSNSVQSSVTGSHSGTNPNYIHGHFFRRNDGTTASTYSGSPLGLRVYYPSVSTAGRYLRTCR